VTAFIDVATRHGGSGPSVQDHCFGDGHKNIKRL
jgi:hypothetical protein